MSGSTRPPIQAVQRSLIVGVLAGLLLGCIAGLAFGTYYAWQVDPAVYSGGAYPDDLSPGYQANYLNTVIDSYIINRQVENAQQSLREFDQSTKIRALGRRAAEYAAVGRATEAQAVNDLAVALRDTEGWSPETIAAEVGTLAAEFQGDQARTDAINNFGAALGVVQQALAPTGGEPAQQPTVAPETPPAEAGGGIPWLTWALACFLIVAALVAAVLLVGRWQQQRKKAAPRPAVVWEGEGPAPIKQWTGTYTFGQDNYDEFFTIETESGDFLGESGMGILEAIPGTSPKQVIAFDVGLFDKTDITTLSRVVMSQYAYNDQSIRAKVEANPQAEAVLATPGTEFNLETSALRVKAKIEDMEYGEGGSIYFKRLKLSLAVFVKEGADLKIGTMDVPDRFS